MNDMSGGGNEDEVGKKGEMMVDERRGP